LLCLFLLSACQPGTTTVDDLPPQTDAPGITADTSPTPTATPEATPRPVHTPPIENVQLWDADTPLSGTLHIENYRFAYQEFEEDVAAFQALHPDVTIVYPPKNPNEPTIMDSEKTHQRVAAGADLDIVNISVFDYLAYADQGLLIDIRQYMEADPAFHMEDYYTNVFDAYIYKGGQYVFPLSFSYDTVAMEKTASPDLLAEFTVSDRIDYPKLIDLFTRSGLQGQKEMIYGTNFDLAILDTIVRDYIDYENKTCDLDNAQFIDMIKTYYAVQEQNMVFDSRALYDIALVEEREQALYADRYLFRRMGSDEKNYLFAGYEPFNLYTQAIPLVNEHGEIPIYAQDLFAIPANSPNKAVAWEFLKYLASEEVQSKRMYSEPVVHRAAYAATESAAIAEFILNTEDYDLDYAPRVIVGDIAAMTADAVAKQDKWNQMPMTIYSGMDITVLTAVFSEIDLYTYGVYTEEQLASVIQEKVSAALEALQ